MLALKSLPLSGEAGHGAYFDDNRVKVSRGNLANEKYCHHNGASSEIERLHVLDHGRNRNEGRRRSVPRIVIFEGRK